jgi:hypothetical protein
VVLWIQFDARHIGITSLPYREFTACTKIYQHCIQNIPVLCRIIAHRYNIAIPVLSCLSNVVPGGRVQERRERGGASASSHGAVKGAQGEASVRGKYS